MKKCFSLCLVLMACVVVCGCSTKHKSEKIDHYTIAFNAHSAVTPVPLKNVDWWLPRHKMIVERIKQGSVDFIFIGDSITHGWEGKRGKGVWERYYGSRNPVNMGFSGDRTQNVLWRLDNGEIDGISPKLAVLMIGTNNSHYEDDSAQEIAEGIIVICQKLRAKLPDTKILVFGIFPCGEKNSKERKKNSEVNEIILNIADNQWIYYLDIGDKFVLPDGSIPIEMMPDGLHLSEKSYEIWAEAIEPIAKCFE